MPRRGIVFDLDDTLVDTASLRQYRDRRDWRSARAAVVNSVLYPGMFEALRELAARGTRVAVVTNSPSNYAKTVLAHHGIEASTLICFHDTSRKKPYPDPVLLALHSAEIDPVGSYGIGDATTDQQAYAAAGLSTVGAGWSAVLDKSAPWDLVIDRPGAFLNLL